MAKVTADEFKDAPAIKRLFKSVFGFAVRVNTNRTQNPYVQVWIQRDNVEDMRGPLKYSNLFPDWFGLLCMGVIYKGHDSLSKQSWGGNVEKHSIAMKRDQWLEVFSAMEAAGETGPAPADEAA